MQKSIIPYIVSIILVSSIILACEKDPPRNNNTGNNQLSGDTLTQNDSTNTDTITSASAVIEGNLVNFDIFEVKINNDVMDLSLRNSSSLGSMTLIWEGELDKGIFPLGNYSSVNAGIFYSATGLSYTTELVSTFYTLKVTEVNLKDNYISGTFDFKACRLKDDECILVKEGKFNRIPL